MKCKRFLAVIGLLCLGCVSAPSIAHAGDPTGATIDWTFYVNGSDTPCSSFQGEPALAYGGYGMGVEAPSGCPPDYWIGQGVGYFESPISGSVEFCGYADDSIDISINERLIVDNGNLDGICGDIRLTEGNCYELTLDYVEAYGYASFYIAWDAFGPSLPMSTSHLIEGPCPYDGPGNVQLPPPLPTGTTSTGLPHTR